MVGQAISIAAIPAAAAGGCAGLARQSGQYSEDVDADRRLARVRRQRAEMALSGTRFHLGAKPLIVGSGTADQLPVRTLPKPDIATGR